MAVNGFESASKAKIWKFPPQETRTSSHYFCNCREHCPSVPRLCVCNCLSLSCFEGFFWFVVWVFFVLCFFFYSKISDTLKDSFHSLVKNTSVSTYSLSHKSSILWLCIYDTWPLFLPCGRSLRDNRGPLKHTASLSGNISYVALYSHQHIKGTELQSERGV